MVKTKRKNMFCHVLPVSINEAGIDVVRSFQASDWLQADACGLVGHNVDQPILELVAGKVGTDEARRVGFGVGQTLDEGRKEIVTLKKMQKRNIM